MQSTCQREAIQSSRSHARSRYDALYVVLVVSMLAAASGENARALPADTESQNYIIDRPTVTVDGFTPERLEEVVRYAYGQLERYATGPTVDLAFTLSAFETTYADHFDEIAYRDLATLPSGDVIDVRRRGRTENYNGNMISWVRYLPSWSTFEAAVDKPAITRERSVMMNSSVAEIFDLAASANEDSELQTVIAFTRYRVRVSLRGRTRDYTAAALWIPLEGSENVSMRVVDHITQGVPEAASEQRGSFSDTEDERRNLQTQLKSGALVGPTADVQESKSQENAVPSPPQQGGGTCSESSQNVNGPTRQGQGTGSHISGKHYYNANFDGSASCSNSGSSCLHECNIHLTSSTCDDTGTPSNSCHRMSNNSNAYTETILGGGPVTCRIGYGCAAKPCLFCQCGLTVNVNAGPGGVTMSTSGAIWSRLGQWTLTDQECEFNDDDDCGDGDPCSPIVVDLRGDGFSFTDAKNGVNFDFNGDQVADERVGWTAAVDDVFLALDRNFDGQIADGAELFGEFTPQPDTPEPNGYNALAEFDKVKHGGNADGRIDERDQVFPDLWIWRDLNHNGVSESEELYSLRELGVDALYLDYYRSHERDEHGNELRYFGRVCLRAEADERRIVGGSVEPGEDAEATVLDPLGLRQGRMVIAPDCFDRVTQSTDVFFVSAPAPE